MDVIVFRERVKHGKLDFHPVVKYGFEDVDAGPYFCCDGWGPQGVVADLQPDGTPPDIVIGLDELNIDPATRFANGPNAGQLVIQDGGHSNSG